ncbi:hypothetical protein [Parasitella parasitica]|uniref:Uncharacterized protein n=1 Tax=Parasitella parasitica TaxID=35722 RepID=A0A0B7NFK9_9FUNG|nr:hypothetical protein [Parasitella parasitica]
MKAFNGAILGFKSLLVASKPNRAIPRSGFPLYKHLQDFSRLETLHITSNNGVLLYELGDLADKCSPHLISVQVTVNSFEYQPLY